MPDCNPLYMFSRMYCLFNLWFGHIVFWNFRDPLQWRHIFVIFWNTGLNKYYSTPSSPFLHSSQLSRNVDNSSSNSNNAKGKINENSFIKQLLTLTFVQHNTFIIKQALEGNSYSFYRTRININKRYRQGLKNSQGCRVNKLCSLQLFLEDKLVPNQPPPIS